MKLLAREFRTDDKAVGFDFEFEYDEATEDMLVSFSAFWLYSNEDSLRVENRHTGSVIDFNHTNQAGDRIYGHVKGISFFDPSSDDDAALWGDFYYRYKNMDLGHFEGVMVSFSKKGEGSTEPLPPSGDVPVEPVRDAEPPEPSSPEAAAPSLPVGCARPDNLFSYIYIHGWPDLDALERETFFVWYLPQRFSMSGNNLFDELSKTETRDAAERAAIAFINKKPDQGGAFVARVEELGAPVSLFAGLCLECRSKKDLQGSDLPAALGDKGNPDYLRLFVNGDDFLTDLFRIWQTLFALTVLSGYRTRLFRDLSLTLVFANALEKVITRKQIGAMDRLLRARIVLPAPAFPLTVPAGTEDGGGSLETFAIGDLQMVQQQLLRYEAGEIAEIINLMRGERKEIVRRNTSTSRVVEEEHNGRNRTDHQREREDNDSLQRAIVGTLCKHLVNHEYGGFKTNYGPPTTAVLDGSFSVSVEPGEPGKEDETLFARQIITETADRIAEEIHSARCTTTLNETEKVETRVFDNTHGETDQIGVYRWVNKIYSARVVHYGTRLMLELLMENPSSHQECDEWGPLKNAPAESSLLQELDINSYEDITEEKYARLAAHYRIRDLEPAPASEQIVSATLQSDTEKTVAVPKGYVARKAKVSCMIPSNAENPSVQGLVGTGRFSFTENGVQELELAQQDREVPIALMQPNSDAIPTGAYVVTVEITCCPSESNLRQWQIKVWCSFLDARDKARAALDRYEEIGFRADSEHRYKEAVRAELKRKCMNLFLLRYNAPTPLTTRRDPAPNSVFYKCLERMFEWSEMDYRLHGEREHSADWKQNDFPVFSDETGVHSGLASSNLFTRADFARVLLPVKPQYSLPALYYLASGCLWMNDPEWTPVHEQDVTLVNELERMDDERKRDQADWVFALPTTMQVLENHTGPDTIRPAATPYFTEMDTARLCDHSA